MHLGAGKNFLEIMLFLTTHNSETVNGRPELAAFDAVLGRSLTVGDLDVTYTKHPFLKQLALYA